VGSPLRKSQPQAESRLVWGVVLFGVALAVLTGCGFSRTGTAIQAPVALRGNVHGGQQPVSGASVELYAAGTGGIGSPAKPLLSNPVRSDNAGNFSIPATYFCPSASSQLYLVALGGNPGLTSGVDNRALALMAMLGPCSSLPDSAISVNEVTTVGSVWPLAAYMRSPIDLGSESGDAAFSAATSSVNEFVNIARGISPGISTPESYFAQNSKLYTLADVLDKCVNSPGGSAGDGSPCGVLFSIAARAGGSVPKDTMSAAMRIAQSPFSDVSSIFSLTAAPTAFQPTLTVAPDDWTLSLSHPVAAPSISLETGTYIGDQEVTISEATPGTRIYYTTDGTVPTSSSPFYSGALSIDVTSTVQAIAVLGLSQSSVASSTLTITTNTPSHAATKLAFLQQPSNASTQTAISPAITVAIEDANGNVVSSATNPIQLSLSGDAGGLGGTLSVTPENGIAVFSNLTVSAAGTAYTLSATSQGLISATSISFTISQPSPVLGPAGVAVTPGSVTLTPSQTQIFTASVSGTSNQGVTWSLSPAAGSISATGLYIAPQAVPSSPTITITATSVSDPTISGSAKITIVPPQAAGYSLAWEDTFPTLSMCTTNAGGCNWYYPGLWNVGSYGAISDPLGTYVTLNWVSSQNYTTNMSTCSVNGLYCHAWTYGYFEISMAFNPAIGNWPALWLMPVNYNLNSVHTGPELDIFEWQSQNPTAGYSTIHAWSKGADLGDAPAMNSWSLPPGTDLSKFNTYGALWTPTAIYVYFNNHLVETISTTSPPFNTQFAGQYPMFLVLSEQGGCSWAVNQNHVCSGQTNPLNMQVQWVHIYSPPSTD
jgi:Chitobiase/beta-hexosaminidase C-terminal domain/Glycosyl hydrolases family 16